MTECPRCKHVHEHGDQCGKDLTPNERSVGESFYCPCGITKSPENDVAEHLRELANALERRGSDGPLTVSDIRKGVAEIERLRRELDDSRRVISELNPPPKDASDPRW